MAVTTNSPTLQMSWLNDHVVAWRPGEPSVRSSDIVEIELPSGSVNYGVRTLDLPALIELANAALLGDLPADTSPSVRWFAAVYGVAVSLVRRGRVLPHLAHRHTLMWDATWQPLATDLDHALPLLRAMPPVVRAAGAADPQHIFRHAVDAVARASLSGVQPRPTCGDSRTLNGRAAQSATKALLNVHPGFVVPDDSLEAVARLAAEFQSIGRRAAGEPLVRGRLRLAMPAGALTAPISAPDADGFDADIDIEAEPSAASAATGPLWSLSYELVDLDDRSRWCTGDDLLQGTPAASDLAREPRYRFLLRQQFVHDLEAIAAAVPELADWAQARLAGSTHMHRISLEVAAATLEAVDAISVAGLELIAPERLVRARTSTRAFVTSSSSDASPSSGRLTKSALVQWKPVVDNTPISPEQLEKAALQGATLIQVGGRWVQIDRAEARRALANLDLSSDAELSPLELVMMAAELEGELEHMASLTDVAPPPDDPEAHPSISADGWAADLLAGLPDSRLHEGVVPEHFVATLRPYQKRGLGWLQFLRTLGLGGCLADDMGLGKTPTTLAHLAGQPGPHLVVCPLSVVRNWESEAARFTPLMRVMVHHGAGRRDAARFARDVLHHELVITTYQIATRDLGALQQVRWSTVVFDEAQALKNPDTKTARALRSVFAEQRIALTGTPIENRLSELWSIFNTVTPGLLGNATQFRKQYALPIERHHNAAATAALRTLTAPFLLRRTKADRSLVPDLPDKIEQVAWATLTREQATMYQQVVNKLLHDVQSAKGMQRRGVVLSALTRLKQICNHPAQALKDGSKLAGRSGKLHRFDELITDLLDAGERALVFTQYVDMGVLLQRHLHEHFHLSAEFLQGSTPKSHRDRMVDEFQAGTSASPLLLVSLRAGGTGLNLTAASRVVHFDRWWNPAVEDQATDRAWRIGQERSVFVHKLVCQGTVEERIDALINDKRKLAHAVVGTDGESWITELSTDELRDLVVLDTKALDHPIGGDL